MRRLGGLQFAGYIDPGSTNVIVQIIVILALVVPIGGAVALVVWLVRRGSKTAPQQKALGSYCAKCGAWNGGHWRFCSNCGGPAVP